MSIVKHIFGGIIIVGICWVLFLTIEADQKCQNAGFDRGALRIPTGEAVCSDRPDTTIIK